MFNSGYKHPVTSNYSYMFLNFRNMILHGIKKAKSFIGRALCVHFNGLSSTLHELTM